MIQIVPTLTGQLGRCVFLNVYDVLRLQTKVRPDVRVIVEYLAWTPNHH